MSWDSWMDQARHGRGPLKYARRWWRTALGLRLPLPRLVVALLYAERGLRQRLLPIMIKILYREPLLRYRCSRVGARLNLEGAIPLILGGGTIELGSDVSIGGRNTWLVGLPQSIGAALVIGDGTAVNFGITISVMKRVTIGRGTLIAHNVQIYDNSSHPLDPERRLRHETIGLDESAPVVIGDNVWIATGALILKGVHIGDNAVVAAGAVVSKSVPPATLVAGNPARVVRSLSAEKPT